MNPERTRIEEASYFLRNKGFNPSVGFLSEWEKWGPYVAERSWGTVREDYSVDGDAWSSFPHDHARFRAFRWSEDGIAGISDRYQVLLFAPVFWNGVDPILKERLFGLSCFEGNHGEDVKEIYYYLDATPTHSYLKYLYKYPQTPFPYQKLVEENVGRGVDDPEYELLDTGIFNEDRYFDLYIEYAKAEPDDICIRIEAINRGPAHAPLHILPQLWFRNQWSWEGEKKAEPIIRMDGELCMVADDTEMPTPQHIPFDYHLGKRYLYASSGGRSLFTNNDTNQNALWEKPNDTPYVKDAFHQYLIQNHANTVNPKQVGTKSAFHYFFPNIAPGERKVVYLRLTPSKMKNPLESVEEVISLRKAEADLFYQSIHPKTASAEEKEIQRQAFAGMIWNKQIYNYDVGAWIEGDNPKKPPPEERKNIRNIHWRHVISMRVFLMPDKWEFPWFAAWDLSFHALTFALIDMEFAKQQLWLLLFDQFQHPNGALPAYEWEFSDVNPPVQAWAVLKIFELEKKKFGKEDYPYLEKCFHKLLLNFAWWINKVDSLGHNIFEGGFLGMDNIGFFTERSEKLPPGFLLDQADGSGWISILCLNLMRISLILAKRNAIYEGLGIKFFQHFVYVTAAMRKGYWRHYDMWCEEDGFFYSTLRCPDGKHNQIRVRSLTGVIPFFACDVLDEEELKQYPDFYSAFQWFIKNKSHLTDKCVQKISHSAGTKFRFGLLDSKELARFLTYLWDPNEFRSEFGLRSLSKYHKEHPVRLYGQSLCYEPGETKEKIKGGNSNWRGPIWVPINYLLIETLKRLGEVFQDSLQIKIPNEEAVTLDQMAESFSKRLLNLFKKDQQGNRPMFGNVEKFQKDPHFKDHLFFYEHFHADSGRGLGASHQTGWTALVANLIDEFNT
ncbi:MAG TPA: hypothetical protein VLE95_02560 [Chlamydiales bacterium]|nr:hypothetical protein [Chlamydiales bacterium]